MSKLPSSADLKLSKQSRETQRKLWANLSSALPSSYDVHKGGSGDADFMSKVDAATGYWQPKKGAIRWLFHVLPTQKSFQVQLPQVVGAKDLPGAVSTIPRRKFVLSYLVATLFQGEGGEFVWPPGWQWTLFLVLRTRIPETSNSIKIHKLDLPNRTVLANKNLMEISEWSLVGNLEPATECSFAHFPFILEYREVGRALAEYIAHIKP